MSIPIINPFPGKNYNSYSEYLAKIFPFAIRKIPVNAGFTCPTRDGTKSFGGCTYCNNDSFNPYYGKMQKSVSGQIDEGIGFFSKKYKSENYLVYFQAYTNTYGDFNEMKEIYSAALSRPEIKGIVIGTRPDCVNDEILDYLAQLSKQTYVAVEYGIESTHNSTLEVIKRGHLFEDSVKSIKETAERGINTGAHIILYLPGETEDMMLKTANRISELPVSTLKIHQLQIVKGTVMAKQYKDNPGLFNLPGSDQYADFLVRFLERLNPGIIIERFLSETPPELIIAPKWGGIRHGEFILTLQELMNKKQTYQGRLFT